MKALSEGIAHGCLKLYVFGSPRLERDTHPIDLNLRKALDALCVHPYDQAQ
jgi:hypothetical protein